VERPRIERQAVADRKIASHVRLDVDRGHDEELSRDLHLADERLGR